jgi:pyruvate dehydrogenase (quinone)
MQMNGLGERVTKPSEVGPTWDRALAARRPFVLDMVTDPDIAPLPPHITFKRARLLPVTLPQAAC